jgi:hypothetical protein
MGMALSQLFLIISLIWWKYTRGRNCLWLAGGGELWGLIVWSYCLSLLSFLPAICFRYGCYLKNGV